MAWPTATKVKEGAEAIPCAAFADGAWEITSHKSLEMIARATEPYLSEIRELTGGDPHKEAILGGLLIHVAVTAANNRERIMRGLPVPE